MKTFEYEIKDELGLHARPAGLLAKEAKKFESKITISDGEKTVTATQLMMLMSMGIKKGCKVTLTVEGPDEDQACAAIEEFFKTNL